MAHIIKNSISRDPLDSTEVDGVQMPCGDITDVSPSDTISLIEHTAIVSGLNTVNDNIKKVVDEKDALIAELSNNLEIYENTITAIKTSVEDEFRVIGERAGLEEAANQINEKLSHIDNIIGSVVSSIEERYSALESHLVEIIYSSVLKLTGKCPTIEIVSHELHKVISEVVNSRDVHVHISPCDYEMMQDCDSFPVSTVDFIKDEKILPGGFIIESNNESIDARLDKKLDLFKELLLNSSLL